jgi:ribosomal protein S18 acetylase RimI-like enzyme
MTIVDAPGYTIERLEAAKAGDADVRALAALLVDAVKSGAAVSFLDTLELDRAEGWWRSTLATSHPRASFLVARDARGEIVGTVQYQPAWAPNQPHRAEICKLMVHSRCRKSGLGARLMGAAEGLAGRSGLTLLTLDAKRGGAAERLYRRLGWTEVGTIPGYALDPDGKALHSTVIFYKDLGGGESAKKS